MLLGAGQVVDVGNPSLRKSLVACANACYVAQVIAGTRTVKPTQYCRSSYNIVYNPCVFSVMYFNMGQWAMQICKRFYYKNWSYRAIAKVTATQVNKTTTTYIFETVVEVRQGNEVKPILGSSLSYSTRKS